VNKYYAIKEEGKDTQIHGAEAFWREFNSLPVGGYSIEVKRTGRKRTLNQNDFYWLCMQIIADAVINQLGHNPETTTKDSIHDMFKTEFNYEEIVNPHTGEVKKRPQSTANLTTKEFSEYFGHIQRWTVEWLGITLPEPNSQLEIKV